MRRYVLSLFLMNRTSFTIPLTIQIFGTVNRIIFHEGAYIQCYEYPFQISIAPTLVNRPFVHFDF